MDAAIYFLNAANKYIKKIEIGPKGLLSCINLGIKLLYLQNIGCVCECVGFVGLRGLSIEVMVVILYKLFVLLPYTNPTPKLSPHRRLCISTLSTNYGGK